MYKMADKIGLDTTSIKPGHENDTITFSEIMHGVNPIIKDCTAENGKTYTITANTQDTLDQAVAKLTHTNNVASSKEAQTTPPLPEVEKS